MLTKKCSKCGESKGESDFKKDMRYKDSLTAWCKECFKEYQKEHYKKNRERIRKNQREAYLNKPVLSGKMVFCHHCNELKHAEDFTPGRIWKDGIHGKCRECCAETCKRWRGNNKDKVHKNLRVKSEAKFNTGAIPLTGICEYCGAKDITWRHHIIPREYGIHSADNLIEVCRSCHKKAHEITQKVLWKAFYDSRKFFIPIILNDLREFGEEKKAERKKQ